MKKMMKGCLALLLLLIALISASLAISNYRRNQVQLSVVNVQTYKQADILDLLENTEFLYVMIYDSQSNDCIYLDEVLLKEISYNYNGIEFEDIVKIVYEDIDRTYNNTTIKNTYHVDSLPAIVKIQKSDTGFETVDAYEWIGVPEQDNESLIDFLARNELLK